MVPISKAEIDKCLDGADKIGKAAEFSGLPPSTLYAHMAAGRLPYLKIGRSRRIPRRALVEFMARHMTGGWAVPENEPSK